MVKKDKIHYEQIYRVITTSKVDTIQQRNSLPKCTEFSSHKFFCADNIISDNIIYVVSEDVNFRFHFAV